MKNLFILGTAISLDIIIGDPPSIPHPIRYIGRWIKFLERIIRARCSNLKLGGFFLLLGSVAMVFGTVKAVLWGVGQISDLFSDAVKVYIIYSSLAAKCLDIEAKKVYSELKNGTLNTAREKIGYLVGRDTSKLDGEEIARAAVETVAENTVDGVLAPLFYLFIGLIIGIPAEMVYIYKTVNTLDSMVGYKNEKYGEIGYFSAKFDDFLNYLPARLGSVFMVLAGMILRYDVKNGLKVLIRDRRNHKSPNCGYPESAAAGLLNIQLGGTNVYFGEEVYKPTIGDKNRNIEPNDIVRATKIMYISELVFVVAIILTYIVKVRC